MCILCDEEECKIKNIKIINEIIFFPTFSFPIREIDNIKFTYKDFISNKKYIVFNDGITIDNEYIYSDIIRILQCNNNYE